LFLEITWRNVLAANEEKGVIVLTKFLAIASFVSLGLLVQSGTASASDDLLLRCAYANFDVVRMKSRPVAQYQNPVSACGRTRYVSNLGMQAIQTRGCRGNTVMTTDRPGRRVCSF